MSQLEAFPSQCERSQQEERHDGDDREQVDIVQAALQALETLNNFPVHGTGRFLALSYPNTSCGERQSTWWLSYVNNTYIQEDAGCVSFALLFGACICHHYEVHLQIHVRITLDNPGNFVLLDLLLMAQLIRSYDGVPPSLRSAA